MEVNSGGIPILQKGLRAKTEQCYMGQFEAFVLLSLAASSVFTGAASNPFWYNDLFCYLTLQQCLHDIPLETFMLISQLVPTECPMTPVHVRHFSHFPCPKASRDIPLTVARLLVQPSYKLFG
jgi:hypothetical protein